MEHGKSRDDKKDIPKDDKIKGIRNNRISLEGYHILYTCYFEKYMIYSIRNKEDWIYKNTHSLPCI
jgi:hypothetical protein